jgi:hypothetical protein
MDGENQLLEFEKLLVHIQDLMKNPFRGIYKKYLNFIKKLQKCQHVTG